MPTGVQQNGLAVKFGVNQTFAGFLVQSRTHNRSPRVTQEIVGEQGLTKTVIHAGFDEEVSASLIVETATTPPAVSDVLVDGAAGEWLVMAISESESNEAAVTYDITLKKHEGLDLTPAT